MKKTTITIISIIAVLLFTECKKYQDGPLISFRSKKSRVEGTWNYDKVLVNNEDKTAEVVGAEIEFATDGTFTCKRNVPGTSIMLESKGSWALSNNDCSIDLLSTSTYGSSLQRWNILKLKNKELWLENVAYESKTEWHLTGNGQ